MSQDSQAIIRLLSEGVPDAEIVARLNVSHDHVARIRALLHKAANRIPYTEKT